MSSPDPGTQAIDAHIDAADGSPAAHRWTPRPAHTRVGDPPLHEITAHRLAQPDHWHLVTYGLSELGESVELEKSASRSQPVAGLLKEPAAELPEGEVQVSGWGFELTLRLADPSEEPIWAVQLLTNLAAYVWSSAHPFAAGHHLDLRGPIRLGTPSAITAAAVVPDPGLEVLDGPYGSVEFLQVVGVTADELELCRSWSTDAVLALLGRDNPMLVTDLARSSLLDDPVVSGEIALRAAADGSELTELRVSKLRWRTGRLGRGVVVEMGSGTAAALGPALRREIVGPGATFSVTGDRARVHFAAGEEPGWRTSGEDLMVEVPLGDLAGLAALFDGRTGWGRLRTLPGLRVHVVA